MMTGCTYGVEVGPVELPPKQGGNIVPMQSSKSPVTNIYIDYQNKFDVQTAVADFMPKGIIPGEASPMIPLDRTNSDLQALGFTTYLSKDGEEALLVYNDSQIKLEVGDNSLYLDDKPGVRIVDAPFYNNTTMYVPIIPILDALKLDYEVNGTDLTIGGMYTDDTGSREEEQPS